MLFVAKCFNLLLANNEMPPILGLFDKTNIASIKSLKFCI